MDLAEATQLQQSCLLIFYFENLLSRHNSPHALSPAEDFSASNLLHRPLRASLPEGLGESPAGDHSQVTTSAISKQPKKALWGGRQQPNRPDPPPPFVCRPGKTGTGKKATPTHKPTLAPLLAGRAQKTPPSLRPKSHPITRPRAPHRRPVRSVRRDRT